MNNEMFLVWTPSALYPLSVTITFSYGPGLRGPPPCTLFAAMGEEVVRKLTVYNRSEDLSLNYLDQIFI